VLSASSNLINLNFLVECQGFLYFFSEQKAPRGT
jgi:hypothetical protein